MRRSDQRGEGRFSFFLTAAVFVVMVFAGVKYVPVRIDAYTFKDTLREEARYASIHRNDDAIKERILDEADVLEIPLDPDNLTIRRTRSQVIISAKYDVPIDFIVTTYVYKFRHEQKAPLF
jgi:hypothetical protein